MDISSRPICEGPSGPIETPQCEPTIFRFGAEYWAIRNWSNPRVKKAAKVEAKGINPSFAIPSAVVIIFCSAINISKYLSGNFLANFSE